MARSRAEVKRYAKQLRRHQTVSERRMWGLVFLGFWAQRVTPIGYIGDYYNPLSHIIVEVDGGIHRGKRSADELRDKRHRQRGIYTIRLTDSLVINHRFLAFAKVIMLATLWQLWRWFHL